MLVYYFSRTGRSKRIAEALAQREGVAALQIRDGRNWSGGWGYAKAAMAALRNKGLPVQYEAPGPDDDVAVSFPVWAGRLPPAVKTFCQEVGRGRIIAVPTSLGSQLTDREGFKRIADLVGDEIRAPEDL